MDEEVVLLEEQLAGAHADIERLQELVAAAEARALSSEERGQRLERELEQARLALNEHEQELALRAETDLQMTARLQTLQDQAQRGVECYREAILAREPDLPADLLSGDTIEAVEASLAQARQTVARVRQHLEQQAQTLKVPNGAPARSSPQAGDLSAAEKIRFGMQQA